MPKKKMGKKKYEWSVICDAIKMIYASRWGSEDSWGLRIVYEDKLLAQLQQRLWRSNPTQLKRKKNI